MLDHGKLIDLGLSPDLQTLTSRAVAAAEALGFGLASGVLIRGRFGSPNAVVQSFGNPPDAFVEASKSLDDGLRDPLLSRLLARPGHVAYDQRLYVDAGAADLWDCQAPFGYRHGLSCSLHQPGHAEAFLFGIDCPDALPTDPGRLLRLKASLQIVSMHAQSALARLVGSPVAQAAELTRQEAAALQLAGAKIYAQRGNLVSTPSPDPRLVHTAARKLGAKDLPDAVLRAIDGGLIQR